LALLAEMEKHAVAVLGSTAGHVVEEDWSEASVEGLVD